MAGQGIRFAFFCLIILRDLCALCGEWSVLQLGLLFQSRALHVLIDILEEPICHGIIAVEVEGKELDFDARPSDAISLALRARVPIYVSPAVVKIGAVVFSRNDWAEGLEEKAKLQN